MHPNESREDYLEAILILSNEKEEIHAIDLCNQLGFSKPSVSIALKKLISDGTIYIDESHHIHLTESGLKIANNVFERHVILKEAFISLGISEDIAIEDACRVEHDLSDESFEAIKNHFNNK